MLVCMLSYAGRYGFVQSNRNSIEASRVHSRHSPQPPGIDGDTRSSRPSGHGHGQHRITFTEGLNHALQNLIHGKKGGGESMDDDPSKDVPEIDVVFIFKKALEVRFLVLCAHTHNQHVAHSARNRAERSLAFAGHEQALQSVKRRDTCTQTKSNGVLPCLHVLQVKRDVLLTADNISDILMVRTTGLQGIRTHCTQKDTHGADMLTLLTCQSLCRTLQRGVLMVRMQREQTRVMKKKLMPC